MSTTFVIALNMVTVTCCAQECGIVFGVPQWWEFTRRKDHTSFYCPNGHRQSFTAKTEEDKLREQLASAQGNLNYYQAGYQRLRGDVQTLERSRAALKGQATKLRKRAANGVCAFCNRHFVNVERHVRSRHPGEPAPEPAHAS